MSLELLLNEIRYDLKKEEERRKGYIEEEMARAAKIIEKNEEAVKKLYEVGLTDISISTWATNRDVTVRLGERPRRKAERAEFARKFQLARAVLGRLEVESKQVEDRNKKMLRICVSSRDYPNLRLQYFQRLPKSAKCKIVTRPYYTSELVCEIN